MAFWTRLIVAAGLFAAPAAAQDGPQQTVEGAQEFLRLVSTQFGLITSVVDSGDYYSYHANLRFEPASVCVTNVSSEFKWRRLAEQSSPDAGNQANFESFRASTLHGVTLDAASRATWDTYFNSLILPPEINWASVSSIETVSARMYGQQFPDVKRVIFVHTKPVVAVVAPDAALAARIAYAMEFLRTACDKSAETGF